MSGICGIYAYGRRGEDHSAVILAMRDAMRHRGPVTAGVHCSSDRAIALGHRSLGLGDRSHTALQPLGNADGAIQVLLDGRIANYSELRRDLEARGYAFQSHADAELLLRLYEEYGTGLLPRLRGAFALAIWDGHERRLFLARDRVGLKPLYHATAGGRFLFGSEIKALAAHPALERDLDEVALYHYLTFLTTPAPQTLFRGISKLPAGHQLTVNARGEVTVERWWDLAAAPHPPAELLATDEACAEHLRHLLTEATADELAGNAPTGIFLSGGIDSTLITALVQRLRPGPIQTFSVGYRDAPDIDELGPARWVAQTLGTRHQEIVIDYDDLVSYLPHLVHAQDEPLADWNCVPLHYVSRLASEQGLPVALVGEGSDEQFAGYSHYLRYLRLDGGAWSAYRRLPGWLRNGLHRVADPIMRRSPLPREIRELVRRAAADEPLFLSGAVAAWECDKHDLMAGVGLAGGNGRLSSVDIARGIERHFRAMRPDSDFLDGILYQEFQLRLPELLLMRVDKIAMSTSVETRAPFLDHRLVEFASHIPTAMKLRGQCPKYILKRAVRGIIPDEVIDRKKQGFSVPIKQWLRGPLADHARRSIMTSRLRERQLFDYAALDRMLELHRLGRRNFDTLIWSLLNLSLWYDRWIAAEPERTLAAV